ncbi:hypothetical protein LWI28_023734 [Acer negundo]|uniref:Uncharacterized protein n=1 Tax=Acer negundo TaxID=4023 RepID=A0AAD5NSX1_ACENE|nr:hypothetical protein LWI28_023734 [Acer negundo]KAK4851222.1 hypothetical protein QYF36_013405 [Acer negundo]
MLVRVVETKLLVASGRSSSPHRAAIKQMDVQPITVAFPAQKLKQINKKNLVSGKLFGLPDGWEVELRPRTNEDYRGKVDQVVGKVKKVAAAATADL